MRPASWQLDAWMVSARSTGTGCKVLVASPTEGFARCWGFWGWQAAVTGVVSELISSE